MSNKFTKLSTGAIVAIGGGELKDLETLGIDKEIKKLSGKKNPRALFIGTASNDALGYWDTFKSVYGKKLGCITDVLFLVREKPLQKEIKKKILSADIIYVGGGNTLKMLTIWRKYGVDKLLRQAHEKGIVLSGLSAGAICWFKYGLSDSRKFMEGQKEEFSFMRIKGLGLMPLTLSPHHIREKKTRDLGLDNLIKKNGGVALAVDDNAAIVFKGEDYKVISSKSRAGVNKVLMQKGKINKINIKTGKIKDLLFLK